MNNSTLWYSLLAFLHLSEYVYGQNITLHRDKQEDIGTICAYGVIIGTKLVFKAVVDYRKDQQMRFVQVYIQKKTDRLTVPKVFNLQKDCYNPKSDCKHINAHVAEIKIEVSASKEYNGTSIYGTIITSNSEKIDSEHLHLPVIYDLKTTLTINGKELSTNIDNSVITVNMSHINIVYNCESQVFPCLIEISSNNTKETVQRNGSAIYDTEVNKTHDVYVTIKYGVCRLDREQITIDFTLQKDQNRSTVLNTSRTPKNNWLNPQSDHKEKNIIFICTIVIVINIVIILLCFLKSRVKKLATAISRNLSDEDKESNEPLKGRHGNPKNYSECMTDQPDNPDLKKMSCKKNSDHNAFIPVDKVKASDLPSDCNDDTVVNLIRKIANVTVRVCVMSKGSTYVLKHNKKYLSHECFENLNTSVGTGIVIDVRKFTEESDNNNVCPCKLCKKSDSPKKNWGIISILTSSFLICDDNEARQSSFTFKFKNVDTPKIIDDGFRLQKGDISNGWCVVEIATHEETFLDDVEQRLKSLEKKIENVNSKYSSECDERKIAIIVSHPHNCEKHVSVGYGTEKQEDVNYTSYEYTVATCPGSVGAFVYFLGSSNLKQFFVHCGPKDYENNVSSSLKKLRNQKIT